MASYLTTAIGIPVYLHYCGGELENVSYVIRKVTCCGEDEEDAGDMAGCCKDENLVLRDAPDFTLKQIKANEFVKAVCQLFQMEFPVSYNFTLQAPALSSFYTEFPPPKLLGSLLISTSVIRI